MDKKQRLVLKSFIGLFSLIFLSSFILGANAINITHPIQDVSISGTYTFSGILDTNTVNLSRGWAWYMYSNGTNVTISANFINGTGGVFNASFVTTGIYDVDDLVLWMRATDQAYANNNTDSNTGIDVDNGLPTATVSSTTASSNYNAMYEGSLITYGLDADNTRGISSCRVIFRDRSNGTVIDTGTTMTGNACANTTVSCRVANLFKGESYEVIVQATDGNSGDRTNSSTLILNCLPDPANAPVSNLKVGMGTGKGIFNKMAEVPSQAFNGLIQAISVIPSKIAEWFGGFFR